MDYEGSEEGHQEVRRAYSVELELWVRVWVWVCTTLESRPGVSRAGFPSTSVSSIWWEVKSTPYFSSFHSSVCKTEDIIWIVSVRRRKVESSATCLFRLTTSVSIVLKVSGVIETHVENNQSLPWRFSTPVMAVFTSEFAAIENARGSACSNKSLLLR